MATCESLSISPSSCRCRLIDSSILSSSSSLTFCFFGDVAAACMSERRRLRPRNAAATDEVSVEVLDGEVVVEVSETGDTSIAVLSSSQNKSCKKRKCQNYNKLSQILTGIHIKLFILYFNKTVKIYTVFQSKHKKPINQKGEVSMRVHNHGKHIIKVATQKSRSCWCR